MYKVILNGHRDADITFDTERILELTSDREAAGAGETGDADGDERRHIIEILDGTSPAFDFERLYRENRDNLLGKYIERFRGCAEDSEEYQALCEGVAALLAGSVRR